MSGVREEHQMFTITPGRGQIRARLARAVLRGAYRLTRWMLPGHHVMHAVSGSPEGMLQSLNKAQDFYCQLVASEQAARERGG